jgi:hypothetical protein
MRRELIMRLVIVSLPWLVATWLALFPAGRFVDGKDSGGMMTKNRRLTLAKETKEVSKHRDHFNS